MKRLLTIAVVIAGGFFTLLPNLAAQDLVITNARVIVGNGTVINRGSIVVRGGRIASVAAGNLRRAGPAVDRCPRHDRHAGFHRRAPPREHGARRKAQMQALLDAGYTTVLSGGGPAEGNITLRDHIDKGAIKGPRIIPSGRMDLANGTTDAGPGRGAEACRARNQVHR